MTITLLPKSLWSFPTRIPSIFDEDQWPTLAQWQNGLTVSEDDKNIYVEAAVPGIDPKDVEVSYDRGVLWIKAEGTEEEKGKKYYRKAEKSFSYRVALPADVKEEKEPEAVCKNGTVSVTFTKTEKAQPKKIPVKT